MTRHTSRLLSSFFALSLAGFLLPGLPRVEAQNSPSKPAGNRAKWDMDYGPFLNLSVQMPGENPGSTPKGLAVRVGEKREGTLVFDTDLLRCTGGWVGGFLDFKGVAFSGSHGGNPGPVGSVVFRTSAVPGWSQAGSFVDPRPLPTGFGASTIPYGPLPAEWAKYKGLYRHGEQVVLAYTVGRAEILEMPTMEGEGARAALVRSFDVRSGGAASTLLVAEVSPTASLEEREGCVVVADDASKADSRLVLRAAGAPSKARWVWIAPGRLGLELPEFRGGERFKLAHWKGSLNEVDAAVVFLKGLAPARDLASFTQPGPALWPQKVVVQGQVGTEDGAFQLDTVTLPVENPWNSWLRLGAIDLFKDGRIAFSTLTGDVWIGSGLDAGLQKIEWKRFAAGLHQPLGLRIVEDVIYLTCRDGLVRLIDSNGDGEADFYENFNNQVQVTPNFHEFMFDLQTDSKGNFYFAKGGPVKGGGRGWDPIAEHNGTMMRVSRDGSKFEVFATGLRAPNGMCVGPGDVVTSADNEGTWVPMCYLHIVKQGGFLSVPDLSHREPLPTAFDPHVCFFPKSVDNSSGGQVWVTSDRWGPLKGRLLHLSYGQASLYEVLLEEVNGVPQGGVTKVPLKFASGIMRARFSPADGQLYVAGQRGWQTVGAEDGAIHRVRYTGKPHEACSGLRVTDRGIHLRFDEALDPETAGNPDNYSVEQYNYRWTSNYGSKDYRPSDPAELGHDLLDVAGVALSEDRKSVFLKIAGLQPVMQSEITMRIKAASGRPMPEKIWHTINAVGKESGPELKLTSSGAGIAPKTAGSGVALTLSAEGVQDVRKDRLIALHVPEGSPASPFLAAAKPFKARWETVLSVPLRKQVKLSAEGKGLVKVRVNGEPVFEGSLSEGGKLLEGRVDLRKGGNALVVEYDSPASGDATCRLLWSAADFAPEPVDPTALYVPAERAEAIAEGARLREGRQLFAQSNCVACHDSTGVLAPKGVAPHAMPEMSRGAPLLTEVGSRFNEAWVAQWILNPHAFRAGSRMPAVLHGPEAPAQAADLAAFLCSQKGEVKALTLQNPTAGGALFGNLGCIACHSTPMSKVGNDFDRVSLNHVSAKWEPAALRDFLLDPQKFHPGTRMPKTPLSEAEAVQLVSFLMSFPKEATRMSELPKGDMARGAALLASAGCLQCHAGVPGTALPLSKLAGAEWSKGCLAEEDGGRGGAPNFRFSAEQRRALREFSKAGLVSVERDSDREFAQRAIYDLRCVACHQLDAKQSVWSLASEEANMLGALRGGPSAKNPHGPRFTTSIPNLTWLGEKLQPAWSAKILAGELSTKPRDYVFARMPAFPADATRIAVGLSHGHGFSEKSASLGPNVRELAADGEKLLSDQGGFACTVCHDLGKRPASAPFEAPALNLAMAPGRLRQSYFERWLLNPQRIDPETKMPRYSDSNLRTQIKQPLEGDGLRQFDAIRQYLISIQEN
jgi:mono/diheme cytochrome c family protein/glucose/arabinose dehydrogenase